MSYLNFRVANNGTDATHTIVADFNIVTFSPRLELYHGFNLLELIHECGSLVNLWHDICVNSAA
jgi:hypothetical protein